MAPNLHILSINKKMKIYKTKHAEIRQQHRGIKNKTVELLLRYGKKKYQHDGTALLLFPRKIKSQIEKKHLKIKNLKNAYAVILIKHNRIMTVGHRYKRTLIN